MRQRSSQIRKRRVIHTNSARHGLLFCQTYRSHTGIDEDYTLSTGERLRTFRWKVVSSSWTAGPEMKVNWPVDRAKRPGRLESSPTPLWEFHNHQMLSRNVAKKLPIDAAQNPKRSQTSFIPHSKPEIMQLWKFCIFCYQHAKRMHRLRLARCFLYCVVHVYAGNFTYKKIIPQQVKGKKK